MYILYLRYNKLTELHALQVKASPWKSTISGLHQKHQISFLVLKACCGVVLCLHTSVVKVLLSPPENSTLQSVTVTADHGLSVTKAYRIPIKIPGMMGS
jgi:hypothetical protein